MRWSRTLICFLLWVSGQWAAVFYFAGSVSHPQRNPWNGKFFPFILKCCLHIKHRNSEAFHCATHTRNMLGSCWAFTFSMVCRLIQTWTEILTWNNTISYLLPGNIWGILLLCCSNNRRKRKITWGMNSLFRTKLPPCLCLTLVLPDKKKRHQPVNSGDLYFTHASEAILSWH